MNLVRRIANSTLLFLAISAIVGAIPLILNASGEPWQMPQNLLQHSPFHSYLLPGAILLLSNGVSSLVIFLMALRRSAHYGLWIALQGCVLAGWISVEVLMLRFVIWPHYFYWAVALALILCGLALRGDERVAAASRKRRNGPFTVRGSARSIQ